MCDDTSCVYAPTPLEITVPAHRLAEQRRDLLQKSDISGIIAVLRRPHENRKVARSLSVVIPSWGSSPSRPAHCRIYKRPAPPAPQPPCYPRNYVPCTACELSARGTPAFQHDTISVPF